MIGPSRVKRAIVEENQKSCSIFESSAQQIFSSAPKAFPDPNPATMAFGRVLECSPTVGTTAQHGQFVQVTRTESIFVMVLSLTFTLRFYDNLGIVLFLTNEFFSWVMFVFYLCVTFSGRFQDRLVHPV